MAVRCRRSSPRRSHGLPRCSHSESEEASEKRGGRTGGLWWEGGGGGQPCKTP